MKPYEVYYLDTDMLGIICMIVVTVATPYEAFLKLLNLGYEPIRVKQLGLQSIQWGK